MVVFSEKDCFQWNRYKYYYAKDWFLEVKKLVRTHINRRIKTQYSLEVFVEGNTQLDTINRRENNPPKQNY